MPLVQENSKQKLITTKYEAFWFDDSTIYFRIYPDSLIELDDIRAILQFQKDQNVGKSHKRLVYAEALSTLTKAAREHLEANAPDVAAEAFVIPALAQKIIFNLYTKLRKNEHPIKAFDQTDEALSWLNQY